MSDPAETRDNAVAGRKLADAIREVRNAAADRTDVVVDLREAQRTRLELLADELQPVFLEVPADVDWFDFALSSGAQPRLWIDAVAHIAMARDRRNYRFVRDTRLGRTVLAESHDLRTAIAQPVDGHRRRRRAGALRRRQYRCQACCRHGRTAAAPGHPAGALHGAGSGGWRYRHAARGA